MANPLASREVKVKYAAFDAGFESRTESVAEMVAAVPGKTIRVLGLVASMTVGTTITFYSNTTTPLTGPMAVRYTVVWPASTVGYCETLPGESLCIKSQFAKVGGTVVYAEIAAA